MRSRVRNAESEAGLVLDGLTPNERQNSQVARRRPTAVSHRQRSAVEHGRFRHRDKPKTPGPWTTLVAVPVSLGVFGLIGVFGVQIVNPPQTCSSYASEINELVEAGWEVDQFQNMDDGRVEVRCGEAHDIAQIWEDLSDSNSPSNSGSSSGFGDGSDI